MRHKHADEDCHDNRDVKLADGGFDDRERPCRFRNWQDVAVTQGCQRDEAEIEEVAFQHLRRHARDLHVQTRRMPFDQQQVEHREEHRNDQVDGNRREDAVDIQCPAAKYEQQDADGEQCQQRQCRCNFSSATEPLPLVRETDDKGMPNEPRTSVAARELFVQFGT